MSDVRKIMCQSDYVPTDPMELCNRLLVTCYMGTENSSQETKQRAAQVCIFIIFEIIHFVHCI